MHSDYDPHRNCSMSVLQPLRRVLTGYDGNGESILLTDDNPEPMLFHPKSTSDIYTIFRTEQTPAKIEERIGDVNAWAESHASYPKFSSEGGAIFRSVDYPPPFETVSEIFCQKGFDLYSPSLIFIPSSAISCHAYCRLWDSDTWSY